MTQEFAGDPVRVLIGSAGRRVYLIRWFKQALARLGLDGDVFVTENDPTSSSFAAADGARQMPRYDDPGYRDAMLETFTEVKPTIYFSVNDFELSMLAKGLAEELRKLGTMVLSLDQQEQHMVEDKFLMAQEFQRRGIPTPETVLGSDSEGIERLARLSDELVVKHRFGSGSSGLYITHEKQVDRVIELSARNAPATPGFARREDVIVIQPLVPGVEYGVDVIAPIKAEGTGPCGVLARRKLRMRSGETDKAITVDSGPFRNLARSVAEVVRPRGLVDTDVIVRPDGTQMLIDVNPRFGGGYVFSHLAGADVPAYYLAQVLGLSGDREWLRSRDGVVAAKFEDAVVTSTPEENQ